VKIRAIGRLVPVDRDGYIVSDVDPAHIKPPWDAPIAAVVDACTRDWEPADRQSPIADG
jgi:hypothetical protein